MNRSAFVGHHCRLLQRLNSAAAKNIRPDRLFHGGTSQALIRARQYHTAAKKRKRMTSDDYLGWSKEALIERIKQLETVQPTATAAAVAAAQHAPTTSTPMVETSVTSTPSASASASASVELTPKLTKKERRAQKTMDLSKMHKRRIAFRVVYLGHPYNGFATQISLIPPGDGLLQKEQQKSQQNGTAAAANATDDASELFAPTPGRPAHVRTVEDELFLAMLKCRLISSPQTCGFSRCGRTDKGVSGTGQVISVDVRSIVPPRTESPASDTPDTPEWLMNDDEIARELPYVKMLNKALPETIRVIAWAPVAPDFDARFDCSARRYKYFFYSHDPAAVASHTRSQPHSPLLDIEKMKEGARLFLGTHDFRNFCKLDPQKNIMSFERQVLDIDIKPAQAEDSGYSSAAVKYGFSGGRLYCLDMTGSAFLWHQVRCMMSILFQVGRGNEEPSIVSKMLNPAIMPAKPVYEMASDIPLVLYDCIFGPDKIPRWVFAQTSEDATSILHTYRTVRSEWEAASIRANIWSEIVRILDRAPVPVSLTDSESVSEESSNVTYVPFNEACERKLVGKGAGDLSVYGGGRLVPIHNYQPLEKRQVADTYDIIQKRYNDKIAARKAAAEATPEIGSKRPLSPSDAQEGGDGNRRARLTANDGSNE
ncbi:tRNA pseudouridine synthase [Ramicandelaber brevisporus]|nr:tRNA pseudouridine synthase [Ramicandelaber brevisporus]